MIWWARAGCEPELLRVFKTHEPWDLAGLPGSDPVISRVHFLFKPVIPAVGVGSPGEIGASIVGISGRGKLAASLVSVSSFFLFSHPLSSVLIPFAGARELLDPCADYSGYDPESWRE